MALKKVKTNASGSRHKGRYVTRAEAKGGARKARRAEDKVVSTIVPYDLHVEDHGSVWLLRPLTEGAQAWIGENLPEDRQEFAGAVVVEARYVIDIIIGMVKDGLNPEYPHDGP
jgi:hypothetical protein